MAEDSYWYDFPQFGKKIRTDRRLHEKIWKKNYHRGKDKRFFGNYTQIPRGRVFEFEDEGFKVFTGSWINQHQEVKELIVDEFRLPRNSTEFLVNVHLELWRGWSQELI